MPKEIIASLHEIDQITSYLSETLPSDAIIFLHGDLASGKTTLTQAIAKERGVESEVTSPTFSLQQCYTNNLYHYDLYRLSHEAFMQMGLFEEFEKTGWHIVEWGSDALKSFLEGVGYNVHIVEIVPHKEKRIYRISS
ncbi:MAG: tRNA (adenosine(37)-N6)-threonylcarbamoyltransferase complex ATPase subunit type 1 TsaE [Sulfurovum sp.]|nr:tRNA (adenosine(37)-N6)-threonylcarbamoyltransferase complex ATPase subunit type 1 TsaE [Sulfurovum sp.]MCB4746325.1 tRNA (adenosine(37)-N6)-threonylcarbamoyltransferase complex ATPase subunit type 1 TsaE [Sulfurovum sp.]MCB4748575.1 tRNA (adenosine(37)-N6)-threonylcarbamoyltransferase complex ATPase subunit type 1 TsaE [Sulfurovum sp.]MCB4754686.1 tRNA (adenosine(37)-N6)-threonylcarbamoyltransferase complex ATPase subunit type 1 TsaE [Sulfurovum sp.]MCB4763213.1 tRNA (adenosine(37)-N6)-thre